MKTEKTLNESPLLNAKTPQAKSTINLDKMTKKRFTQMNRSATGETSSLRVIIYVLIVIVVGVVAALLVRQLIAGNNANSSVTAVDETNSQVISEPDNSFFVDLKVLEDSEATNQPSETSFKNAKLVAIGTQVDQSVLSLEKISYTKYQTFVRIGFQFKTSENRIPQTNISDDDSTDILTIATTGLTNIPEALKSTNNINDIVQTIKFDSTLNQFNLALSQNVYYRAFSVEDFLFIDIRTEDEVTRLANKAAEPTTTTTVPNTPTTTTPIEMNTTDSNKPAAPFYTNTFSDKTQHVSSKVSTNSISLDNYYTWDQGTFFEISLAQEGKKGDEFVPNSKAYLASEGGKDFIYWEIENLTRAALSNGITAIEIAEKTNINTSGANFVGLSLKSFDKATGKAVYKIELKKKATYQLLTQLAYGDETQILSIQIRD